MGNGERKEAKKWKARLRGVTYPQEMERMQRTGPEQGPVTCDNEIMEGTHHIIGSAAKAKAPYRSGARQSAKISTG